MDLVAGAMGSLLPKLLKLLGDEYKLQTGMKKKVKLISQELESTQAFLRTVSDVPWYELDDLTKAWANEAREVSFDMEDVLDTFLVRFQDREPANPSRLRRSMEKMVSLFSMGKARRDISCAVQEIKNRLQELADQRARYRIDDIVVNPAATIVSSVDPRLQAMYTEVANLVGINKPRDDLISMLSSQPKDVADRKKIVAIVGVGGLGKTTLAKAVYDKIRVDFECGAFVPVGRNPNLAKLLMDILYELDKIRFADIHTKSRNERHLIDNLREFLIHKRYFIVIDDIWETTSWEETIRLALPENTCGSRIVITTRKSQVAQEIGDEVYRMPPLSDANSKTLFYTRIFGAKEKWYDDESDEISIKVLKKCEGVPLAIITMASLLVGKPRERWSDVFTSVGFGHKDNKQVDNTTKILSFSYYDMPAYLRTCLLYLSVFPEDCIIEKEPLIWKWIAEGFIQGKPGIQLYELGEQYFNDLVNRSMVQVVVDTLDDMVEYCRLHDMVLDLIRSISFEENFISVFNNNEGTTSSQPRAARRLALHYDNMDRTANGKMVDMLQVRSFIAIRCSFGNWEPLSSCKLLRVLDLEGCKNARSSHLVHLGNLLHLRYLGLKDCLQVDELPNVIGDLRFLKTLNLEGTDIRQLPASFNRLAQLASLKGDCNRTLAPGWIGKLTSLEELQVTIDFSYGSEEDHARKFLKALGSLREMRVLRCRAYEMDESMQRDLVLALHNMHKLQDLNLAFFVNIEADTSLWGEGFVFPRDLRILYLDVFQFSCLPPCIGAACLPNLTHLSLLVEHVDQKDLEFLGKLPELCYLHLCTNSTATISNISPGNGYFRKLRFCCIPWSMIHLQHKEGDSSISFHIWNGIDAMPFGSSKNNNSLAPCAAMPNLEVLVCWIFVRALKDNQVECGNINIGLEYLPSLKRVTFRIDVAGASAAEVDEAEAALRKATEVHPNRPVLRVV